MLSVFCGSVLFFSVVGVREQAYCLKRTAGERNHPLGSTKPLQLCWLISPAQWLYFSNCTGAAEVEL